MQEAFGALLMFVFIGGSAWGIGCLFEIWEKTGKQDHN